ncbi:MAG: PKD domain-containing protein [Methanospirillum sp.]|nr:PKD domain-containing protein [Methanospirillum sp.]
MTLSVSGAVISGSNLNLDQVGSNGTVDLVLDSAPSTGFAGYELEISFSSAGIAQITTVSFPDAFSMNTASDLPSENVSIVAVDLQDQYGSGASEITLATLGVTGLAEGTTTMKISVSELTDDSGNSISATVTEPTVVVGTSTVPTTEPTAVPTTVPTTAVPTEVPTTIPTTEPTTVPTTAPVTPVPTETPSPEAESLNAAFSATPQTGTPPLSVSFTDLSTGDPRKWRWDFGDGTMADARNVTHVYGGIGRYTVTLEVLKGNSSSVSRVPEMIRVVGDYPTGPSGLIMVNSSPTGAEVSLNDGSDRYMGTTPGNLIVPAGSHDLRFTKKGYQPKTIHITVRPNEVKLIPKVTLPARTP